MKPGSDAISYQTRRAVRVVHGAATLDVATHRYLDSQNDQAIRNMYRENTAHATLNICKSSSLMTDLPKQPIGWKEMSVSLFAAY